MRKILVCDDEVSILNMIKMFLSKEGYNVVTADNGKDAIKKANSEKPDIIILDVMLPDISGFEVLKEISKNKIPTIMLTAKNDIVDKVLGLEFGADDYMTKPFDVRELLARVKALLRRLEEVSKAQTESFSFKNLEIDFHGKQVRKLDKQINLTPKEYEILRILAMSKGSVVSREELLNKVWGYDYFGDARTVDIHIVRLRKKLEDNMSEPEYVKTVYGFGYRLG